MKKSDNKPKILPDFFWPSYSDLMTTLFFIMTLLYVISVTHLVSSEEKAVQAQKRAEEAETIAVNKWKWVQNVQKSVEQLQNKKDANGNPYFKYDEKARRFFLTRNIKFKSDKAEISNQEDMDYLLEIGKEIQELTNRSQVEGDLKSDYGEVSYLIIIEGSASWDRNTRERCWYESSTDCKMAKEHNLALSHDRAVSLFSLWRKDKEIGPKLFNHNFTEFQLVGKGLGGKGRDEENEENNQRISISIMPKINYKDDKN